MTDLPEDWATASLGEIAGEIRSGFASGRHNATGSGIPHLRPMNVSRLGEIHLDDVKYVDPGIDDRRLVPGDVLFNNTNSPALVGKSAVFTMPGEYAFSNHMTRVRTSSGIDPRFLAAQLHYLWMTGQLSHLITNHVNQASISARVLSDRVEVRIAPSAEQERIVAAIEEHLSHLDAAEASLTRARTRLPAVDAQALAASFEGEYPVVPLAAVASVGSGATPKRTVGRYWEGGTVPWVASGALNTPLIDQPSALITEAALRETSVKLWPAGTVLVAMYGEGQTRGRAAELTIESTCNQACAAIRPDPQVLIPAYLRWFLNSQYEQNRRLASGGVQPNLSLGLVKAMPLAVPPLSRQREIVAAVESQSEQTGRLNRELGSAARRSGTLRRSIFALAFSGQLVPQDPSDEQASVLLDRIRADRESAAPKPRRGSVEASR